MRLDDELPAIPRTLRDQVTASEWEAVCGIVQTGAGSPVTTSAGRLFDAVSALCGIRARVTYEGQAAAELEGAADPGERGAYEMTVEGEGGAPIVLDPRPAILEMLGDLDAGVDGWDASPRAFTAALAAAARGGC